MASATKRPASVLRDDDSSSDSEHHLAKRHQPTSATAAAIRGSDGGGMPNGADPQIQLEPQPQPQAKPSTPQPVEEGGLSTARNTTTPEMPAEEPLKAMDSGQLVELVLNMHSALTAVSAQYEDVSRQLNEIKACLTVFFGGGTNCFETASLYIRRMPTAPPVPTALQQLQHQFPQRPPHRGMSMSPQQDFHAQARTQTPESDYSRHAAPGTQPNAVPRAGLDLARHLQPPPAPQPYQLSSQEQYRHDHYHQTKPARMLSFSTASTMEVAAAAVAAAAAASSPLSNPTPAPTTEWGSPPLPATATAAAAPFMRINSPPRSALKLEFPPELGGMPRVLAYSSLHTVADIWREYKHGLDGVMPIEVIESQWQSRWRPDPKGRTWFSRRKLIWDKVREYMHDGLDEDSAVAAVEAKRATRSMNYLVNLLTQERKDTKLNWKKNAAAATAEKSKVQQME